MSSKIHKYFKRNPAKWNIVDYLDECDEELFKNKLGLYIMSLENISDTEKGEKRERAKELLDRYRKASFFLLCWLKHREFGGVAEDLWSLVPFKSRGRATKLMLGRG
jgi:hypothetical protein